MSRLALIQAEFRQRQQEEKENKLIAMLEDQQERALRAARNYSGNSNGSNSLSSSSSTTSSQGSTGGGKVRQMFEERRSQHLVPPARPPLYAKSNSFRRPPVVPRTRPLEPVPRIPPPQRGISFYKPRGVSLERKHEQLDTNSGLRRSRSQYYVNAEPVQATNNALYNKNGNLLDTNQNLYDRNALSHESLLDHEYEYPDFTKDATSPYIQPVTHLTSTLSRKSAPLESNTDTVDLGRRPLSNIDRLRAQFENSNTANNDDEYAIIRQQQLDMARVKQLERDEEIRRQQLEARRIQDELEREALLKREEQVRSLREREAQIKRQQEELKRQQEEIRKQQENRRKQAELELELKKRKEKEEAEKRKLQEEAKRREEELLKKIREQEEELKRLQAAAKATATIQEVSSPAPKVPPRTRPSPSRKPPPSRAHLSNSSTEESDDARSTASEGKPVLPPKPSSTSSSRSGSVTSSASSASGRRPTLSAARNDLVPCEVCGRNFAPDRVEKHQSVCAKTSKKKRKIFDVTKMRVKGTEAESYVIKSKKNDNTKTFKGKPKPGLNLPVVQPLEPTEEKKPEEKKSDWRKKHENFLETIRAAKMMQKHLAAGGKISDLPPPPPSDTSDYITCPHCERRFSPAAADRHIPKCESIKSNKKKR